MSSPRERNAHWKGSKKSSPKPFNRKPDNGSDEWLWGWHAVSEALGNPRRGAAIRILATPDRARELESRFGRPKALEVVEANLRVVPRWVLPPGLIGPAPQ